MKVVVGEILPLALVVTISPLNIIPAILLLFTTKPLITCVRKNTDGELSREQTAKG